MSTIKAHFQGFHKPYSVKELVTISFEVKRFFFFKKIVRSFNIARKQLSEVRRPPGSLQTRCTCTTIRKDFEETPQKSCKMRFWARNTAFRTELSQCVILLEHWSPIFWDTVFELLHVICVWKTTLLVKHKYLRYTTQQVFCLESPEKKMSFFISIEEAPDLLA